MTQNHPVSVEEEACIEFLGGIDHVADITDRILQEHGIHRKIFSISEKARIRRGRNYGKRIEFEYDPVKSIGANITKLFSRAEEIQAKIFRPHLVSAMLQHLVGAKLDVVLGIGKITHHGFSVADHSTDRRADFQIDAVAIHVTTNASEGLIRKCADNLKSGLKPVIVTIGDNVLGTNALLKNASIADRVDVLDVAQFLTANVYERSLFHVAECRVTLVTLLQRYNAIVASCETDPTLRVDLGKAT